MPVQLRSSPTPPPAAAGGGNNNSSRAKKGGDTRARQDRTGTKCPSSDRASSAASHGTSPAAASALQRTDGNSSDEDFKHNKPDPLAKGESSHTPPSTDGEEDEKSGRGETPAERTSRSKKSKKKESKKKSKVKKRRGSSSKCQPPPDRPWMGLEIGQMVLEGLSGPYEGQITAFQIRDGDQEAHVRWASKAWGESWVKLRNLRPKIMLSPKRKRENTSPSLPNKKRKPTPKNREGPRTLTALLHPDPVRMRVAWRPPLPTQTPLLHHGQKTSNLLW